MFQIGVRDPKRETLNLKRETLNMEPAPLIMKHRESSLSLSLCLRFIKETEPLFQNGG
jgi:hypothetical protein